MRNVCTCAVKVVCHNIFMAHRMTMEEFFEHCQSDMIAGYGLREGQTNPETYDELVTFMGERLGLTDERNFSMEALSYWLMDNRSLPGSCSPVMDTEHVTTVILIGELWNRDEYVARLPEKDEAVVLPPSHIVRALIEQQG